MLDIPFGTFLALARTKLRDQRLIYSRVPRVQETTFTAKATRRYHQTLLKAKNIRARVPSMGQELRPKMKTRRSPLALSL